MELEGKLATFPLSDVLKFIEEKGHTGSLSVRLETGGNPHIESIVGKSLEEKISIREGHLAGLGSLDYYSSWANVLVRRGLVNRWEVRELKKKVPGQGEMLHEMIGAALEIPREEILKCVEFHTEEVAGWLFTVEDGEFSFHFDESVPVTPGLGKVRLSKLIEKGKEWSRALKGLFDRCPSPGTILVPVLPAEDDPMPILDPREWQMMARIDGRRNLHDLLPTSPFPSHAAASLLESIMEKGLIAAKAPKEDTADSSLEFVEETPSARGGIFKRILAARKEQELLPTDRVGQYAVASNRLSERIRERAVRTLNTAWKEILREFPGAGVLVFENGLFAPYSFTNSVSDWGNHPEYWETVRHDCEEALLRFLARIVREVRSVDGRKKAETLFQKAVQDIDGLEGFPVFEELG